MMCFSLDHPDLNQAIVIQPCRFADLDVDEIINTIEYVAESAQGIPANEELDLRIKVPKRITLEFEVKGERGCGWEDKLQILKDKGFTFPTKISRKVYNKLQGELLPFFPDATDGSKTVLDVGCEESLYKKPCEDLGWTYVGTDIISSPELSFLSDAHALPAADGYFDMILANNLFEHLQYPFVAVKEFARVLKSGGTFLGTVSFLEPFHMGSHYHHTHLGIYSMLRYGGFEVQVISPSPDWDVLRALASMGFVPRVPAVLVSLFFLPVRLLYNLAWSMGIIFNKKDSRRRLNRFLMKAGSFSFVAKKK
jgi:SAM-dependent methyltransferase